MDNVIWDLQLSFIISRIKALDKTVIRILSPYQKKKKKNGERREQQGQDWLMKDQMSHIKELGLCFESWEDIYGL